MIKRSVPITFSAFSESSDYAQGMKDGITHTLECLLHECDVIVRISPYVIQLTRETSDDDRPQKFQVRARFTVREKRPGAIKGEWIKTDHAYYEEEFDDRFDTDREWKGLTDEDRQEIEKWIEFKEAGGNEPVPAQKIITYVESKLWEKNSGTG